MKNNEIYWFLYMREYDDAYYKWLYASEKDKKECKEKLDKMRHLWFNS